MNTISVLDYTAIILLFILELASISFRRFPTVRSRAFNMLLGDALLSTALVIGAVYSEQFLIPGNVPLRLIIQFFYLSTANLLPLFFFIFIYVALCTNRRVGRAFWWKIFVIITIETIFVFTSQWTHLFVYIDGNGVLHQGRGMPFLNAFSFFLKVAGFYKIIRGWKFLSGNYLTAALVYIIGSVIMIIVKYNFHFSLITITCAVSLFFAFLSIQNPKAFKDDNLGVFNLAGFKEFVVGSLSDHGSLFVLKMTRNRKIKDFFGLDGQYYITKQFMEKVSELCDGANIFYLFSNIYIVVFNKPEVAYDYAERVFLFFKSPFAVKPKAEYDTKVEYPFSYHILAINNFDLITKKIDTQEYLTINETLSLLNYIGEEWETERLNLVTEKTIEEYKERIKLSRTVQAAIKNESFEVFLQPIYDLKEKKYTSAESLLRLPDPDEQGKYISPLSFIPKAEQNGDILRISEIALHKTCQFINKTKLFEKGVKMVNVNLSMIQCMQEGIVAHILEILAQYNIDPKNIRFEITETMAASSEEQFASVLNEMYKKGIQYALDDYGSGYSNTTKILAHNFSEVKFDKSLIDAALGKSENKSALQHLMSLIKEKNIIALAEGIETKEFADRLEEMGCDLIQGFYYARPMPADEFVKFIEEHNIDNN